MRRFLMGSILAVLVAAMTAGPVATGRAAPAGPAATAASPEVLTAVINAAETFYSADNAETTDLWHAASRVINVTPQHPDVILLQEVNAQSVKNLLYELKYFTGQTWAAAADAYPGAGSPSPDGTARRTSAIIYNTATMSAPSGLTWYTMTAPESDLADPTKKVPYNEAPIVQLTKTASGTKYTFTSIHFWPQSVIKPDRYLFRKRAWSVLIKNLIHDKFPGTTSIVGGDFNSDTGSTVFDVWTKPTSQSDHTGQSYHASTVAGVLQVLSSGTHFAATRDDDYKSATGVFTSDPELGTACHALYETGLMKSSDNPTFWHTFTAPRYPAINQSRTYDRLAINGCRYYYYSDHALVWSLVSP